MLHYCMAGIYHSTPRSLVSNSIQHFYVYTCLRSSLAGVYKLVDACKWTPIILFVYCMGSN